MRAHERFLRYIQYPTTSDEMCEECPSTPGQRVFGQALVREMRGMGIDTARIDDDGYVYATIPATPGREEEPAIGLIAHMDTSDAASGDHIRPQIIRQYDGGDILLNKELGIMMSPVEFESLGQYVGQDLIVTDGTTLLGGDDKAGIAEILTATAIILDEKRPHGKICIGFTPDEEIGRGADRFDVQAFGAAYAYTVDGGQLGELEYENFNAASARVTIHGQNIHPGSAKGKMKNSLLIGMEFHAMLPVFENPAFTEGYEGFSHLRHMEGDEEKTVLQYIIRDHDRTAFAKKKSRFEKIAAYLNERYGEGTVELVMEDSYYNMKDRILPHMEIVERAKEAMLAVGVPPKIQPIRGGTDGARLSFMGLPCPNLSTGAHNGHGRFEYVCIQSMDRMVDVLLEILK